MADLLARVARRGRLGLLDRARVRAGGRRDRGGGRRRSAVRSRRTGGLYATHTRRRDEGAADSVAEAIRAAAAAERARSRSRISCRGTGSRRRAARSSSSRRPGPGGLDVEFDMHTRLYGLTHLYAALPPWALAEEPAQLAELLRDPSARDRMRPHRSILSAGGDWGRVVLLDNPFWPRVRAPGPRLDRRRARPAAARRRLRPARSAASRRPTGDGDHPRLHRGGAAGGVRPSALRPGVRRDDARARRAARRHLVPRRLHLGVVVLPLHGARRGPARPGGGRPQAERAAGGPARARATAACSGGGARRRRRLRPASASRERGTTFEPNQLAEGMRHVLVNGVPTLRDGLPTGQRAGRC